MRTWRDNTPREYVLRLYKFLNASGITVTAGLACNLDGQGTRFYTSRPHKR